MSPHDPRLPIPAAIFARLSSRSLARVPGRSEARRRPSDRRSPGSRTHPRRLAVHRIPARSRGFIADSVRCRLPPCAQQSTPSASSSESRRDLDSRDAPAGRHLPGPRGRRPESRCTTRPISRNGPDSRFVQRSRSRRLRCFARPPQPDYSAHDRIHQTFSDFFTGVAREPTRRWLYHELA
jgi:hypothetical protein